MNIKEAIEQLQAIHEKFGDIPFVIEVYNGDFVRWDAKEVDEISVDHREGVGLSAMPLI